MGHKRTNHRAVQTQLCPLLSESGQTRARAVCPLSANNRQTQRNMIGAKRKIARAAILPKSDQVF
jgi:hypothetical protein